MEWSRDVKSTSEREDCSLNKKVPVNYPNLIHDRAKFLLESLIIFTNQDVKLYENALLFDELC